MKTIALFVPQYHQIPLNDEYWGKGFTEWVNVKNAKPLFKGHMQPRVPLNNNYYNLLDRETKIWQRDLAKKYGIYGFCYYHYWFNGKLLLEKPCEQILQDKELDLPFCFCWANHAWTMKWIGKEKVIMPQFYGDKEEWKQHFEYLLPFFKDDRYIKKDGKPLMVLFRPESIECLNPMIKYWRQLAVENGLPGLVILSQSVGLAFDKKADKSEIDFEIENEPIFSRKHISHNKYKKLKQLRYRVTAFFQKRLGFSIHIPGEKTYKRVSDKNKISYDEAWNNILSRKPSSEKAVPCAFVDWDNSPRYKKDGMVYVGATPQKFKQYFSQLIKKCKKDYKKDFMFIFAWNEWGEGGYLEPDEQNGYKYLEAVRDALNENDEFPSYNKE